MFDCLLYHSHSLCYEFQFNDNQVSNWEDLKQLEPLKKLETVYLERNPIWRDQSDRNKSDPNYRRKIMLLLPWVRQIDATYVR